MSGNKKCKPNQIRNPKTGRCVLKSGRIGKKLLAKSKSRSKKKSVRKSKSRSKKKSVRKSKSRSKNRKCKSNEILNPKTGRCVKRTSRIGKMLVEKEELRELLMQRRSPRPRRDIVEEIKDMLGLDAKSRKSKSRSKGQMTEEEKLYARFGQKRPTDKEIVARIENWMGLGSHKGTAKSESKSPKKAK